MSTNFFGHERLFCGKQVRQSESVHLRMNIRCEVNMSGKKIHSIMKFSEIVARVRQITDWNSDNKVAEFLGITPQNLANKKAADAIPTKQQFAKFKDLSVHYGVNFGWVLTGEGPVSGQTEAAEFGGPRVFDIQAQLTNEQTDLLLQWFDLDGRNKNLVVRLAEMQLDDDFWNQEENRESEKTIRGRILEMWERYEYWKKEKKKIVGG